MIKSYIDDMLIIKDAMWRYTTNGYNIYDAVFGQNQIIGGL